MRRVKFSFSRYKEIEIGYVGEVLVPNNVKDVEKWIAENEDMWENVEGVGDLCTHYESEAENIEVKDECKH